MWWENFILHAALGILATTVKNPEKAAMLKSLFLALRDAITEAFPEGKP